MVDLYIKSFNRAFYLDRCLLSFKKQFSGQFRITVLDDGTPQECLDRLKQKHPEVHFLDSAQAAEKRKALQNRLHDGSALGGFRIPADLWKQAAAQGSDYFLMTEDDVWATAPLNLDEVYTLAKKNAVFLIKLGWLGKKEFQISEQTKDGLVFQKPENLLLLPAPLMDWFFRNRGKFFSILYKLGLVDNTTKERYWALNSILMGFYQKSYWLNTWSKIEGRVDEWQQLISAAYWFRKHRHDTALARLPQEVLRTTFQSSSTNAYHAYGLPVDILQVNELLNRAWLEGRLDPLQNYPKDFDLEYLIQFLPEKEVNRQALRDWTAHFKAQYQSIGCNVEN